MKFDWGKIGLFAGGVLFGTAGISVLTSRDAKKAYTHVTAAALRGKDKVMETVDKVRENADDILADAKAINEKIATAKGNVAAMQENARMARKSARGRSAARC